MLHGSDMTVENNPYEAGLRWTVRPNRPEYIAGEALRKIRDAGTPRKIAGFAMRSRGIARHGHSIHVNEDEVGVVTSGTHSPTLGVGHRHGVYRHRPIRNQEQQFRSTFAVEWLTQRSSSCRSIEVTGPQNLPRYGHVLDAEPSPKFSLRDMMPSIVQMQAPRSGFTQELRGSSCLPDLLQLMPLSTNVSMEAICVVSR